MNRHLATLGLGASLLAACQNYNFNPVGHCIVNPITTVIPLTKTDAADILFVVDDSGSMTPRQQNLVKNFGAFSDVLLKTNQDLLAKGLKPIEFHLAVTTSDVFRNYVNGDTCGATQPSSCCDSAGTQNTPACHPCTLWGAGGTAPCGDYAANFDNDFSSCNHPTNMFSPGDPYPRGDFVRVPGNPRVIHLTADLFDPNDPTKVAVLNKYLDEFKQNLYVGSCGSGEEQHLQAARLALQKMEDGQQPDIAGDEFLHPGAKLAIVWMGDEDDCSNPANGSERDNGIPLQMPYTDAAGNQYFDSCMGLENAPNDPHISVVDLARFFEGIPNTSGFAAGFIVSVADGSCKSDPNDDTSQLCDSGICHAPPGSPCGSACNGYSAGNRFHALASILRQDKRQVVMGSICDDDFSPVLQKIANIVIPVDTIHLANAPAGMDIAQLRIIAADGKTTRKVCKGPALTASDVTGNVADWYFVDQSGNFMAQPSPDIRINHATLGCEAGPGESYRFEALGSIAKCSTAHDCTSALGGSDSDWSCDTGQCHCKGT